MNKYYYRKCDYCSKGISQGILADDEIVCSLACAVKLWGEMNPFTTVDLDNGNRKEVNFFEFLEHVETIDEDDSIWEWYNGCEELNAGCEWDEVYDSMGNAIAFKDVNPDLMVEGNSDLIEWSYPMCKICSHVEIDELDSYKDEWYCNEHLHWIIEENDRMEYDLE